MTTKRVCNPLERRLHTLFCFAKTCLEIADVPSGRELGAASIFCRKPAGFQEKHYAVQGTAGPPIGYVDIFQTSPRSGNCGERLQAGDGTLAAMETGKILEIACANPILTDKYAITVGRSLCTF